MNGDLFNMNHKIRVILFSFMMIPSIAWSSDFSDIDKQAHFFSGYAIESTVYDATDSRAASMSAACGAGVAKELYDQYDYGGFDEKDALATCLGSVFGGYLNIVILEW